MKKLSIFILVAIAALSSCNFIRGERVGGNGNVVTETRDVSGFSAINVSSAIDVYVTQDSGYSVKVETDENLQPFVVITKRGDVLDIRPERNMNLNSTRGIKVYVSAPAYQMLGASGACNIIGETQLKGGGMFLELSGASSANVDLDYTDVKVEVSGACSVEIKGQSSTLDIDGSGSSHIKAMELKTTDAKVSISGASGASVFATGSLDAEASGASEIVHDGGARVNSHASGASSVRAK